MVTGLELLVDNEQEEFEQKSLRQFRTDKLHEVLEHQTEYYDDSDPTKWRGFVTEKESYVVWDCNPEFKNRCEHEWGIEPDGNRGRELAHIVTMKEAENGSSD